MLIGITSGNEIVVLENGTVKNQYINGVESMHYNYEGTIIIFNMVSGGIRSIIDCDYEHISEEIEQGVHNLGYKFSGNNAQASKMILAHRYSDSNCLIDPTAGDCRINLYYSYDGRAQDWWVLLKNIVKYDFILQKSKNGSVTVGVIAIQIEQVSKVKGLIYFPDVMKSQRKSEKLTRLLHEYYIVNDKYIYVLKSHIKVQDEFILKYSIDNMFKSPSYIKLNHYKSLQTNLDIGFITYLRDDYTSFMILRNSIEGVQQNSAVLYSSEPTGTVFSISLENINLINDAFADIYKPLSMEYVLIANQKKLTSHPSSTLDDRKAISSSADTQFIVNENVESGVQSYISFNNGGMWHTIDLQDCNSTFSHDCRLNLHLESSLRGGAQAQFIPSIKSYDYSMGIIIANGNTGQYLSTFQKDIGTYISIDGGIKWTQIAQGPHIFTILQRVGLLVLVSQGSYTKFLSFSLDFGKNLVEIQICDNEIMVESIIQDKQDSYILYVYGYDTNNTYAFYKVNFKQILTGGNFNICQNEEQIFKDNGEEGDFEMFQPHDLHPQINDWCYMGAQVSYLRRNPKRQCYIDTDSSFSVNELEKMINSRLKVSCSCTQVDYECDEGFISEINEDSSICVPVDHMTAYIEKTTKSCQFGDYFTLPSGYRLIPGNVCQEGLRLDRAKKVFCADGMKDTLMQFLMWALVCTLFLYISYLFYGLYEDHIKDFKAWWKKSQEKKEEEKQKRFQEQQQKDEESKSLINQNNGRKSSLTDSLKKKNFKEK